MRYMHRYSDEPEFETEYDRQVWIAAGGQREDDDWTVFSPD